MAQYILEVIYMDSSYFGNELKAIVACSAHAVARFVLQEEPWAVSAEEKTGITNYDLFHCARDVFGVVSNKKNDVLSPVNLKYCTPHVRNSQCFSFIIL